VAEKDVGRRKLAGQPLRLLLRVLVRALRVADAALEAGKAAAADLGPLEVQVANADLLQRVGVVIAEHADPGQVEVAQPGQPVARQVAERDYGVRGVQRDQLGRLERRRLVRHHERPQLSAGHGARGRERDRAPARSTAG
jgi:hypothetical protein